MLPSHPRIASCMPGDSRVTLQRVFQRCLIMKRLRMNKAQKGSVLGFSLQLTSSSVSWRISRAACEEGAKSIRES